MQARSQTRFGGVAKVRSYDLKVIAMDDQLVTAKGKSMDSVPLVMMAATKICEQQGNSCGR